MFEVTVLRNGLYILIGEYESNNESYQVEKKRGNDTKAAKQPKEEKRGK
jgi:hypothetical protein